MKHLLTTAVVAVVAAVVLSACSTPEPQPPQIASLDTGRSTATSSSAPAEQRPRLRLDMTDEEQLALFEAYGRCLTAYGVDKGQIETQGTPPKHVMDAANAACQAKQPLPPWEKDPKNPEALDFATRVVQCLRDKGVRYVEVVNEPEMGEVTYGYGGPNNDPESISKGMRLAPECEREAARK